MKSDNYFIEEIEGMYTKPNSIALLAPLFSLFMDIVIDTWPVSGQTVKALRRVHGL